MKSTDFFSHFLIISMIVPMFIAGAFLLFSGIFYLSGIIPRIVFIIIGIIILIIDMYIIKYWVQILKTKDAVKRGENE